MVRIREGMARNGAFGGGHEIAINLGCGGTLKRQSELN